MCSETKKLKEFLYQRDYILTNEQYIELCNLFTNIRKVEYDKANNLFKVLTDDMNVFNFFILKNE